LCARSGWALAPPFLYFYCMGGCRPTWTVTQGATKRPSIITHSLPELGRLPCARSPRRGPASYPPAPRVWRAAASSMPVAGEAISIIVMIQAPAPPAFGLEWKVQRRRSATLVSRRERSFPPQSGVASLQVPVCRDPNCIRSFAKLPRRSPGEQLPLPQASFSSRSEVNLVKCF
jgi:hypothetical protein